MSISAVELIAAVTWTARVTTWPRATVFGTITLVVHPLAVNGAACVVPAPAAAMDPTMMAAAASGRRHRDLRMFGPDFDLSMDTCTSSPGGRRTVAGWSDPSRSGRVTTDCSN